MSNQRRTYTSAEELSLTTQVDGCCPLCGDRLFYTKKSRSYKGYELAHIYPLNPKPEELHELKDVPRLSADVNHPDNLIPLCGNCHSRFDKPRMIEEYNQLADLKQRLIDRDVQRDLAGEFPLDADIRRIIDGLHDAEPSAAISLDLEFSAKRLKDKLDESFPSPTRQKIKHAVSDYYTYIRNALRDLERDTPSASGVIFTQVKAYYLKQKSLGLAQPVIFNNVVGWIETRTSPKTVEAAEIVASFFVQNCEVFD